MKGYIGLLLLAVGIVVGPKMLNKGGSNVPEVNPAPSPAPITPGNGELAKLVPEPAAPKLSAFYRDFASMVEGGACSTTGNFREAQQLAGKTLQDALGASGWAAVNDAISKRIVSSIGTDDVTLDAKRSTLVTTLKTISADFQK